MGSALGVGVLLVVMMVVPLQVQSMKLPEQFLHQYKAECHFPDGTGRGAYFLDRYFWGRQELVRFDSRRGIYEAVTELGEPDVRAWNSNKAFLEEKRAAVDSFCRHNYQVAEAGNVVSRKAKPTVKISPTKADPTSSHTLLLCTVTGFYPLGIAVKWLKNGQEEAEGVAYGEELQNGDWTFQTQVMLETLPRRGDVYACRVEHASLEAPITVQWEPRTSDSARSKVWTGAVGALLGVAFVAVGLYLHLKNKKGRWVGAARAPPSARPAAESASDNNTLE